MVCCAEAIGASASATSATCSLRMRELYSAALIANVGGKLAVSHSDIRAVAETLPGTAGDFTDKWIP